MNVPASSGDLPRPTPVLVRLGMERFTEQGRITEPATRKLIHAFPRNTDVSEVLLKVVTINQIYSTGILAVQPVAERIQAANIDAALQAGDVQVVHRIDRLQFTTATGKRVDRSIYSFATKYCALHQPEHYPIYDGLIAAYLLKYRQRDGFARFEEAALREYPLFRDVVMQFRSYYGLHDFSLRQIDQFLWTLAKGLLSPPPG